MLEKNPFLKPKSSSMNFQVKLPNSRAELLKQADPSVDALDPLNKKTEEKYSDDFVSRTEKNNLLENDTSTNTNVDFSKVDGEDVGPSVSADSQRGSGRFAGKAASAGMGILDEIPKVLQNLNTDPKTKEEATGKVISLASSGAKVGAAFGPIGAAGGLVLGGLAGIIDNANWKGKIVAEKDKKFEKKNNKAIAERQQNYFLNKTSEQIEAEMNIFKESNGILS